MLVDACIVAQTPVCACTVLRSKLRLQSLADDGGVAASRSGTGLHIHRKTTVCVCVCVSV